jgi:nucleoside-diphosphate-sugar epimerase
MLARRLASSQILPSMRVVFTGGSGKAGRHVIPYLLSKGHQVLNLDLTPFPDPAVPVHTLRTDLTNSGQVFNALSTHFSLDEYSLPTLAPPDAVIHFAAYSRDLIAPDNETFIANTTATYNIIEAASKLGIKKVLIASSETVYGVCFTQGESEYAQWPIDEDTYDCNPEDPYACSKLCGERVARSFARRFRSDIYVLRIGNVVEPHEYAQNFPAYLQDPPSRKRNAWSYIDARDLGQICDLSLRKDGLGFQVSPLREVTRDV